MQHVDEGRLHAWLDGELPDTGAEGARALERHIEGCAACRNRADEARRMIGEASAILGGADPGEMAAPRAVPARRSTAPPPRAPPAVGGRGMGGEHPAGAGDRVDGAPRAAGARRHSPCRAGRSRRRCRPARGGADLRRGTGSALRPAGGGADVLGATGSALRRARVACLGGGDSAGPPPRLRPRGRSRRLRRPRCSNRYPWRWSLLPRRRRRPRHRLPPAPPRWRISAAAARPRPGSPAAR
jgi:anti-sigma factor RsiW